MKTIIAIVTLAMLSACASDYSASQYTAAFVTGFADMDRQSGAAYGRTIHFEQNNAPQPACVAVVDMFGRVTCAQ